MPNDVLHYYEEELNYLRQSGGEFAEQHPRIAAQLRLDADQSPDPHVERLLQGFSFISGRIRRKIDEEFPEIAEALLNVLYPHYLAPTPAMAVAQFVPDADQGQMTSSSPIAKHTTLYSTQTLNGVQCRFRTCYPVTLWPVQLVAAQFDGANSVAAWPDKAAGVIRLHLRCQGDTTLSSLGLPALRFFLNGEDKLTYALYELLFNNTVAVQIRSVDTPKQPAIITLEKKCLQPVGFEKSEGLLPYPSNAFLGYRLLHEYFAFPQKFLFMDLCGLDQSRDPRCEKEFEILIFVDRPPLPAQKICAENFLLGCAPIINLFKKTAEPINVDGTQVEYRVFPDLRQRNLEIFSIDTVTSAPPREGQTRHYQPLYSFKHVAHAQQEEAFWYARRKPAANKDDAGTELYLSVVDLAGNPAELDTQAVTVQTTCTNRELPSQLSFEPGEKQRHFEIADKAPLSRIRCVVTPTPALRPPSKGEAQWRLISHLSLNYLSLTDGKKNEAGKDHAGDDNGIAENNGAAGTNENDGRHALQEILRLYNFAGSQTQQQQIERIVSVESRRVVRRLSDTNGGSFGRGLEVTITLDDEHYANNDAYLFSAVLEKFLGLYVSLNSFSELVLKTTQRNKQSKGPLKTWTPRAGEKNLL